MCTCARGGALAKIRSPFQKVAFRRDPGKITPQAADISSSLLPKQPSKVPTNLGGAAQASSPMCVCWAAVWVSDRLSRSHWCPPRPKIPRGFLLSYSWMNNIETSRLADLMAYSAAALFHVGATHLFPIAERELRRDSLIVLGAGIVAALAVTMRLH